MNTIFNNSTQNTALVPSPILVSREVGKEDLSSFFKKSYAQVASSDAPAVSPQAVPHSLAGLHPRPAKLKKNRSYGVKFKAGELEILQSKSKKLGLSLNAFIRAKALGEDYIEKPPEWLRDVLLKLYVEMSRQGNNLNQIARNMNKGFVSGDEAMTSVSGQSGVMFHLMEKLELALAGRRPPDDR